ncbi:MAG TPA: CerR family C-terminal domain-containing protein [Candidatus Limnocylindria bacterium]|nr:CerR family C-terminal domain-containing protein [Candidatus Limnocylindria bacterium]
MRHAVIHADPDQQAATRRALLDAAADVFAEVGFRAATVRDICRRAKANVAAVNYHFGDKAALYTEVLTAQSRLAHARYPNPTATAGLTPEVRFEAFVRSFLQRVLSAELHARHGRIMAREMVEPTTALDQLVAEAIRPQAELLRAIVTDLLGGHVGAETTRLCGMSVVGQILFYCHCQPVLVRLFPGAKFDAGELDRLTAHITAFSLAAIRGFAAETSATRQRSASPPGSQPPARVPRAAASRTRAH